MFMPSEVTDVQQTDTTAPFPPDSSSSSSDGPPAQTAKSSHPAKLFTVAGYYVCPECVDEGKDFKSKSLQNMLRHRKKNHGVEAVIPQLPAKPFGTSKPSPRKVGGYLICPECEAQGVKPVFKSKFPTAMGYHRKQLHGIPGSSSTAVMLQKKAKAPKPSPQIPQASEPKPRRAHGYYICPECEAQGVNHPFKSKGAATLGSHRLNKHQIVGTSEKSKLYKASRANDPNKPRLFRGNFICPECEAQSIEPPYKTKNAATMGSHRRFKHNVAGTSPASIFAVQAKEEAGPRPDKMKCPECLVDYKTQGITLHRSKTHHLTMDQIKSKPALNVDGTQQRNAPEAPQNPGTAIVPVLSKYMQNKQRKLALQEKAYESNGNGNGHTINGSTTPLYESYHDGIAIGRCTGRVEAFCEGFSAETGIPTPLFTSRVAQLLLLQTGRK
jgi:hypothetical protein